MPERKTGQKLFLQSETHGLTVEMFCNYDAAELVSEPLGMIPGILVRIRSDLGTVSVNGEHLPVLVDTLRRAETGYRDYREWAVGQVKLGKDLW